MIRMSDIFNDQEFGQQVKAAATLEALPLAK